MMRKRIGLLTIFPEAEYQQRILPGIFSQAEKYDYDVVVFAFLVQVCNINKRYVHGEFNVFELINFSLFDGIIITPVPMTEAQNYILYDSLPDVVICLSDLMAIGLTNHLLRNGIKVPEQVIVTGYEAVQEASLNNPPF